MNFKIKKRLDPAEPKPAIFTRNRKFNLNNCSANIIKNITLQ